MWGGVWTGCYYAHTFTAGGNSGVCGCGCVCVGVYVGGWVERDKEGTRENAYRGVVH